MIKLISKTLQNFRRNPYKNKKIRFCIEFLFGLFFYIKFFKFFFVLKKISNQIKIKNIHKKKNQKIFYAFSFAVSDKCFFHDFFLAKALELKNSEIIPITLGKKLEINHNKKFKKYISHPHEFAKHFHFYNEKFLWNFLCGYRDINLDRFVSDEDFETYQNIADQVNLNEIENFFFEGFNLGKYTRLRFINDNGVSDFTLVKDYKKKLQMYLLHTILVYISIKNLLKKHRPDIIVMSDSFYYPGVIIEELCKKMNIPTYNYFWGIKNNSFFYSKDKSCQWRDISNILFLNKNNILSEKQAELINTYLADRPLGKTSFSAQFENPHLNSTKPINEKNLLKKINNNKPTAILFANVGNDLSALERSIQFENQYVWIEKTIEFFRKNPQFNLIIKPHPAEKNKDMVPTIETIKSYIESKIIYIPDNVIILDPLTMTSSYEFQTLSKLCLVYTSTTGMEYACHGIPVITAGKAHYRGNGFTIDTLTEKQYFLEINNYLNEEKEDLQKINSRILKAKNYYYYYAFIFAKSFEPLTYDKFDIKLNVNSLTDFYNSKFLNLNNITDSIIRKKDII